MGLGKMASAPPNSTCEPDFFFLSKFATFRNNFLFLFYCVSVSVCVQFCSQKKEKRYSLISTR